MGFLRRLSPLVLLSIPGTPLLAAQSSAPHSTARRQASLPAALTPCDAGPSTVTITQPIQVEASATLPPTCTLAFSGSGALTVAANVTLTLNGEIQAPHNQQIFTGPGTVAFGPEQTRSWPEWFGAKGDGVTDDTAALQAALDALSAGHLQLSSKVYNTSAALTIRRSNVGIEGISNRPGDAVPMSTLRSTSPTADILDIGGNTAFTPQTAVFGNDFERFQVTRAILPSSTARGISVINAWGTAINKVDSLDSTVDFYIHYAPQLGSGEWNDVQAGWTLPNYPAKSSLYGFYLDSADGNGLSPYFVNCGAAAAPGQAAATTYAWFLKGKAINDQNFLFPSSSGTSFGMYIDYTGGGGSFSAGDIHVLMGTFDGFSNTGIYITGVPAANLGAINFIDGYALTYTSSAVAAVTINNSNGVVLQNMQLGNPGGGAAGRGVNVTDSTNLKLLGNTFRATQLPIVFANVSNSVVSGNTFVGNNPSSTLIFSAASAGNVFTGNTLSGTAGTGFFFDKDSTANTTIANSIAGAIPTPYNDRGGSNVPFSGTCPAGSSLTITAGIVTGCGSANPHPGAPR